VTTVLTAKFDFSQPKSAIKGTQAQVDQLKNKAKGAQGALDNAAKSAKGAGAASAFFGKAAKGAVPGVAALGTALKTALGPIALLTSAAGVLTSAFSTLAQQDFAEAKVRSLGVNSEELKARLSDVSRELSGQASVVELTGAAYDVASAGFTNAADAANILKAASLGATGGFSDINTVGDATTSVLNAYGLEADKAAKLVDGFIQTQNDGKIVIGEYAANIAKVAPVAAALGVPLEEVNAAVAQITAGGQGAEVTFTALKTAFAQVAAGKVGNEFKKFGVEINASTLKSDGLAGTLEKIKKSGADAGTILKAFGTEAGPSILALLNDTDKYNKLLENQKNSQGKAAEAAFEASNTINGALKRLQTAFTNIFADGSELGVLLKGTFQVAAVTVEVLGAALKISMAPLRAIFSIIGEIGKAISEALGMKGVNVAFELEKGFQKFLGVLQTISNVAIGVGKVIGQVIGGAIGFVAKATEGLRATILEGIGGLIMTIPRLLGHLFQILPPFAQELIKRVLGKGKEMFSGLAALGSGVTSPVVDTQTPAVNTIQQTNNALGGATKGSKDKGKDKLTEREKQLEAAAKLTQQLERQNELDALGTEEARKLKKLEFAKLDIKQKFPKLTNEEVQAIQDLLQENHNIIEAKKAQKELDEKATADAKKLVEFYEQIGQTIQSGLVQGIQDAITGSKSLGESLSGILKQLGGMFLSRGIGSFGSGDKAGTGLLGALFKKRAAGGYVTSPEIAQIGEGGEPEYVIPSSKMNEAMGRYSRGARGGAVIPDGSGGDAGGGMAGGGGSIDVNYSVERINNVNYVSAAEFERGMAQAAKRGAELGRQGVYSDLVNKRSVRSRIGV